MTICRVGTAKIGAPCRMTDGSGGFSGLGASQLLVIAVPGSDVVGIVTIPKSNEDVGV